MKENNYIVICTKLANSEVDLVHDTFVFVDDADVGRPHDSKRHVEVDDAGDNQKDGVPFWVAATNVAVSVHVGPYEYRDIERHVVDPYVNDNDHCDVDFDYRSTNLVHSQKTTEQLSTF